MTEKLKVFSKINTKQIIGANIKSLIQKNLFDMLPFLLYSLSKPTQVLMPLLTHVANFTRLIEFLYKEEDRHMDIEKLMKNLIAWMY